MCTKLSAVWRTDVARSFAEQQHVFVSKLKVSKTGKACIMFRNFFVLAMPEMTQWKSSLPESHC